MKCLSVSQPFANLIIQGKKTIELRRWNTSFRGEFLIHSPLTIRKDELTLDVYTKYTESHPDFYVWIELQEILGEEI